MARIKPETSDAPAFEKVEKQYEVRYSPKNGEFTLVDCENDYEKATVKSIEAIIIADDRFTVKHQDYQVRQYTGTYKSTKQTITMFEDGKPVVSGDWQTLKAKDDYKFTKVVHLLVKIAGVWKKALMELQGSMVAMWSELDVHGDGIVTLTVEDTPTFEAGRMKLFKLNSTWAEETPADTETADLFMEEVKASYKSEDVRYKFFQEKVDEEKHIEEANAQLQIDAQLDAEDDIRPEDIDF